MVQRREGHGEYAEDEVLLRVVRVTSVRELLRALARGRMGAAEAGNPAAEATARARASRWWQQVDNFFFFYNALSTFRRVASVDIDKP
jgi:hypothetical protein